MSFGLAFAALLIERAIGYPQGLVDRIGHPVIWMGNWLAFLERRMNGPSATRLTGVVAWMIYVAPVLAIAFSLHLLLAGSWPGFIMEVLLATTLLAQKSLADHVRAVADGLDRSLEDGRTAVSHIVGRDPKALDESGVARAALESLAENSSDGVFAPAFWLAIGGLPGLALYKAINTADSMIGHKSERYLHFGWAGARIDDLANLIPARLAGLLYALACAKPAAFTAMWQDAGKHVSPNAGWPESAMAGGLGIRLGGPRAYEGRLVNLAWMGQGRENLTRADIRDGLSLYARTLWIFTALVGALAFA